MIQTERRVLSNGRYDMRGRPPKRYCLRGHDTWITGRQSSGRCAECQRLSANDSRNRASGRDGTVASQWLCRIVKSYGDEAACKAYAERWDVNYDSAVQALYRLRHNSRVTIDRADEWCVALGTHLALVYPDLYGLNRRGG